MANFKLKQNDEIQRENKDLSCHCLKKNFFIERYYLHFFNTAIFLKKLTLVYH